jgi:hypothetical protein
MKQVYFGIALAIVTTFVYCSGPEQQADKETVEIKDTVRTYSGAFNQSFDHLLSAYYSLRDALVEYDTVQANASATQLSGRSDSIPFSEIKGDSAVAHIETAKNHALTIKESALNLVKEKDLEKKKRAFQMISGAMYELVLTVKYDGPTIYHQYCPMAFGDDGATWISDSAVIMNPYLGKKHPKYKNGMLHCGEVTDSLRF